MAQAQVLQAGRTVDYTPAQAVAAGQVVVVGGLVGVASVPIAANALGSLMVDGVFEGVKINDEVTIGAALYWNATGNPVGGVAGSGGLTTTAGSNKFWGYALEAAGTSATSLQAVKVHAASVTANHYGPMNNAIADPGDAEAIPVTASGIVALVTGGTETRTLADPPSAGIELSLCIETDGGTCVITAASAINQTGNNTITMADLADWIRLQSVEVDGGFVWKVVANDGAALSTVP